MNILAKPKCAFLCLLFISLLIVVSYVYLLWKTPRSFYYHVYDDSKTFTLRHESDGVRGIQDDNAIKLVKVVKMISKARLYSRGSKTSELLTQSINVLNHILVESHYNVAEINSRKVVVESRDVCPEEYKGTLFGYPLYNKGFETLNCSYGKPLSQLITIILDPVLFHNKPPGSHQLKQISNFSFSLDKKLSVLVPSSHRGVESNHKNLRFVYVGDSSIGHKWNTLINAAWTKYVLIARGVNMLTSDIRLERLIREIGRQGVAVAGAATRDQNGHWRYGCKQSSYRNFSITYEDGYFESLHECIYCDHIDGPFVAERRIFNDISFNVKLPEIGLFEDFFLWYKAKFKEAIVCPDSMFFIHAALSNTTRQWEPFAEEWDLYRLRINSKDIFFPCDGLNCLNIGHGLHPCCLRELSNCIKVIMHSCEAAGLFCELRDGTLLGAVKFSKVLPWEIDADMAMGSANYTAFFRLRSILEKSGCFLKYAKRSDSVYIIKSKHWRIEAWVESFVESTRLMTDGLRPTKIFFDGLWVTCPPNPGLHSRNRYGHEIYRHAQHWYDLGREDSWVKYDTSKFTKCASPPQQSCLDQYNNDGSVQFSGLLP